MLNSLLFFCHYLFGLIIFTKKWQDEKLGAAFVNILLIGILFSVGWTMTTVIAKALMDEKGLGIFYDRDSFALTILSIAEILFYKVYYGDILANEVEMGKQ